MITPFTCVCVCSWAAADIILRPIDVRGSLERCASRFPMPEAFLFLKNLHAAFAVIFLLRHHVHGWISCFCVTPIERSGAAPKWKEKKKVKSEKKKKSNLAVEDGAPNVYFYLFVLPCKNKYVFFYIFI